MSRKNELKEVIAKTQDLIKAPSCYAGLKDKAQAWLNAIDTKDDKDMAKDFIEELEADITPIDGLVAFAHSAHAKEIFGDGQPAFAKHADELKASGAKYCDCAACAPGLAILEHKDQILK